MATLQFALPSSPSLPFAPSLALAPWLLSAALYRLCTPRLTIFNCRRARMVRAVTCASDGNALQQQHVSSFQTPAWLCAPATYNTNGRRAAWR